MIDSVDQLQKAIEQIHNCKAHFIESVPILETFEGQTVWQGAVYIFDIKGPFPCKALLRLVIPHRWE